MEFSKKIIGLFSSLLGKPEFSDIEILIKDGSKIPGHKLILYIRNNSWGLDDFMTADCLDLSMYPENTVMMMLKWVYTDQIDIDGVSIESLTQLISLAKFYNLPSLYTRCETALNSVQDIEGYEIVNLDISDIKVENTEDLTNIGLKLSEGNHPPDSKSLVSDFTGTKTLVSSETAVTIDTIRAQPFPTGVKVETSAIYMDSVVKSEVDSRHAEIRPEWVTKYAETSVVTMDTVVKTPPVTMDTAAKTPPVTMDTVVMTPLLKTDPDICYAKIRTRRDTKKAKVETPTVTMDTIAVSDEADLDSEINFENNDFDDDFDNLSEKSFESPITSACKRFKCSICGKFFQSNSHLSNHIIIHTGIKAFNCDVCGKSFNRQSSLVRHQNIHTSAKLHFCDICDKYFKDGSYLKKHKRIHFNIQNYACKVCSRKFTDSSNYKRHMKCHNEGNSYPCLECGRKFRDANTLHRHSVIHEKEMNYCCHHCNSGFQRFSQLRKHLVSCENSQK